MICADQIEAIPEELSEACQGTRAAFSAYLDGALNGLTMAHLAAHMAECSGCEVEFHAWRSMQAALGELGPAAAPVELQARLRDALASEIVTGRHLSPFQQFRSFCRGTLAPVGLRLGAGLAATLLILGSGSWFLGAAIPVQANDARMTHMNAPKYLYSQTAPLPIATGRTSVAVLVDAKVDTQGRVYDYNILEGPSDPSTRLKVEQNLLGSVFRPASLFGVPVPGHAMVTFTAISARG